MQDVFKMLGAAFLIAAVILVGSVRSAQQPVVPPVSSGMAISPCSQSALWQEIDAAVEFAGTVPSQPMSPAAMLRLTVERAERVDQAMNHLREVRDLCRGVPKEMAK